MTLIVSLRTVDGIVIAGDSLSTMMAQVQFKAIVDIKCPECGHEHRIDPIATGGQIPSSTFSFAQKVFPFMKNFGVGSHGLGQIAGKSTYFAVRELEDKLEAEDWKASGVTKAANEIGQHVFNLAKQSIPDLDKLPDKKVFVGFQVVGYDGPDAKTIRIGIGKEVYSSTIADRGCSVDGETRVVTAIWNLYKTNREDQAEYKLFSLQDAIDYAKFLITTTAAYQRFSRTLPKVGGEIDIGLVTPLDGFIWIQQKPLGKLIGGQK